MPLVRDFYNFPCKRKEKTLKKSLFQCANSYIMDVKCPGVYKITICKQCFFEHDVKQCSVNLQEKPGSWKVALLEESNTTDL
jgi:hypothetical protein